MVREDILGGLRSALNRGESIKQAALSFLNAGYKQEEIDEAARTLEAERVQQPVQQLPTQPGQVQQPQPQPTTQVQQPKVVQKVSAYGQPAQPTPIQPVQPPPVQQPQQPIQQPIPPVSVLQRVSAYGQVPEKPKGKAVVFILVALLLILVGALVTVFFFKEEIMGLFNSGA